MRDMFWEWLCSLTQSQKTIDIDPFVWRCQCGYKWKFSKWQLLKMFLSDYYVHTCPNCQRKSRYRMVSHVARETDTEEIRENNRWLD